MHKFVINLDSRTDRIDRFNSEMNKIGFDVERFSGVVVDDVGASKLLKGEIGCKLSHKKIIETARDRNLEYAMIFEDDVEILDNFLPYYHAVIGNLPNPFDFIQFGANIQGAVVPHNRFLSRCYGMFATHCYIIHRGMYDVVLDNNDDFPIDVIYKNLHIRGNSYVVNHTICRQYSSYSNIQECTVDYGFLR